MWAFLPTNPDSRLLTRARYIEREQRRKYRDTKQIMYLKKNYSGLSLCSYDIGCKESKIEGYNCSVIYLIAIYTPCARHDSSICSLVWGMHSWRPYLPVPSYPGD